MIALPPTQAMLYLVSDMRRTASHQPDQAPPA